jgi:hypothetical protein
VPDPSLLSKAPTDPGAVEVVLDVLGISVLLAEVGSVWDVVVVTLLDLDEAKQSSHLSTLETFYAKREMNLLVEGDLEVCAANTAALLLSLVHAAEEVGAIKVLSH